MTVYKLDLPGVESNYSFTEKASVLRNETKGGFPYYRNDLDNSSISVNITWTLSKDNYDIFWIFYRVGTNFGELPFLMDLCIDNALPSEYTCYFGNPQLTQVNGGYYIVSDTLEVLPKVINADFDRSLVSIFNVTNGNPFNYLNLFNQIVNVNWPEA